MLLPQLEVGAVDFVVAHVSAKSYVVQAATEAGWTATRAERTKKDQFRKVVPAHAAFWCVPFAVETCECMGKETVQFMNRPGDIAAESGRIPKRASVRWAVQLLSITL